MPDDVRVGGYEDAAALYLTAGWQGVLPIPPGRKGPVPLGFTGRCGKWPTPELIRRWSWMRPMWNLALRVPDDVIGIDVDAYKPEAHDTVTEAVKRCGTLPETFRSTSRDDRLSGIYLYRVPEGEEWNSVLGPGIEIVQRKHRYMVVWPSIHPEGRRYRWHGGDGVPLLDALPELPTTWIEHLQDRKFRRRPHHTGITVTADALTPGRPMFAVKDRLNRALAAVNAPGACRHDKVRDAILPLVRLGAGGAAGVGEALVTLRDEFVSLVGPDRGYDTAEAEFDSMLRGAVRYLGG